MTQHKKCQMPGCHNAVGGTKLIVTFSNPLEGFGVCVKNNNSEGITHPKFCKKCGKVHTDHGRRVKRRVCRACYESVAKKDEGVGVGTIYLSQKNDPLDQLLLDNLYSGGADFKILKHKNKSPFDTIGGRHSEEEDMSRYE